MLLKGENADNIVLADTFTHDGHTRRPDGRKYTFDYMLANPPFGVEWKQQQRDIEREADTLGYDGRCGVGLPKLRPEELFARAYAQWVAWKSGSPTMKSAPEAAAVAARRVLADRVGHG